MALSTSIPVSLARPMRPALSRPRVTRSRAASIAIRCDDGARFLANGSSSLLCGQLVRVLAENQVHVSFGDGTPRRGADNVRGMLLLGETGELSASSLPLLEVPVVGLNVPPRDGISTVCVDYREQGERVVRHLHERGHRRMAIVLGREDTWASAERRKGFVEALTRRGLPVDSEAIVSAVHQPTYGLLHRLIMGWKPTAVFMACEEVAIESLAILREMTGGQVPQELSLVGLETPHVSRFHSPPLTTIAEPVEQLAEAAVRLVLRQMRGNDLGTQGIVVESSLIERASVSTIPAV